MLIDIIYVIVGLIVLVWSADKFIEGAADTATYCGMSPLMVGMLIVGFGTSAPEMVVSAFAAFDGNPGIALGNAYGSNIANIGLVLGTTALMYPLLVSSRIVKREIPLLVLVLLVNFGFFYDHELSRVEAIIMLVSMLVIMIFSTFYGNDKDTLSQEIDSNCKEATEPLGKSLFWLFTGLILLLLSSNYLVKGAIGIAEAFGVSDLIIGLTIVAIGTSLPELASSLAAAKKGESDMVLGNIVGSCLFNALAVVGIAGVIKPLSIEPVFLPRDFGTGMFLTLLLWVFAFGIRKAAHINKKEGAVLLMIYVAYSVYLLATLKG